MIDNKLIDKDKFDKIVENNNDLKKGVLNQKRKRGKKQSYAICQIQPFGDYYALALTKFNEKDEGYLYSNDYANCLLEMWRQLNRYYAQNIVNISLLGAGITRIVDNSDVSNQELLEIMLQILKISKITFKLPSQINIVLFPGNKDEEVKNYDLIRIKSLFRR